MTHVAWSAGLEVHVVIKPSGFLSMQLLKTQRPTRHMHNFLIFFPHGNNLRDIQKYVYRPVSIYILIYALKLISL
jgi:hypothetical protein